MQINLLTVFGFVAVGMMLGFYTFEERSPWCVLGFAFSCVLASVYGFLQGTWPFAAVEAIWAVVAFQRWWKRKS